MVKSLRSPKVHGDFVEGWPSGWRRMSWKHVWVTPTWVRIPLPPPDDCWFTISDWWFRLSIVNRKSSIKNRVWGGARVVEWGRLLSGYWGEILSRRFESCPPRHKNAFRQRWGTRFYLRCIMKENKTQKTLFETQLHPQVRSSKSKPLIKTVCIFVWLVSRQLNNMRTAPLRTLNGPLHHFTANSLILMSSVYAPKSNLCAQVTLKTNRWKKHEMKSPDYFPVSLSHDQFMPGIFVYLFISRIIWFG